MKSLFNSSTMFAVKSLHLPLDGSWSSTLNSWSPAYCIPRGGGLSDEDIQFEMFVRSYPVSWGSGCNLLRRNWILYEFMPLSWSCRMLKCIRTNANYWQHCDLHGKAKDCHRLCTRAGFCNFHRFKSILQCNQYMYEPLYIYLHILMTLL